MRAARAFVPLGVLETQHTRFFTVPTGADVETPSITQRESTAQTRVDEHVNAGLGRPLEVPKCRLSKTIKSGRREDRQAATVGATRPGQDALVPPRVRLRFI